MFMHLLYYNLHSEILFWVGIIENIGVHFPLGSCPTPSDTLNPSLLEAQKLMQYEKVNFKKKCIPLFLNRHEMMPFYESLASDLPIVKPSFEQQHLSKPREQIQTCHKWPFIQKTFSRVFMHFVIYSQHVSSQI